MRIIENLTRKAVLICFYITYCTLVLLFLAPSVLADFFTITLVLLFYVDFIIDALLRHASEKAEFDREARLLVLSFFVHPVIIALGFYENIYLIKPFLSFWDSDLIAIIGLIIYVLMITLHLYARFIIGKFGTAVLVIEDDHELITSGPYAFVRHPIYTAAIIGWIGMGMALRSVFVLILYGICYCWLWLHRANLEEKMLVEVFGEKYQEYMKKTKKIIPFLY